MSTPSLSGLRHQTNPPLASTHQTPDPNSQSDKVPGPNRSLHPSTVHKVPVVARLHGHLHSHVSVSGPPPSPLETPSAPAPGSMSRVTLVPSSSGTSLVESVSYTSTANSSPGLSLSPAAGSPSCSLSPPRASPEAFCGAPPDAPPRPPSSSNTNSARNFYQCAQCQRRYSRPEHLARHIQTHTLGKRFSCHVCGKAFARTDLLKRHVTNHEKDNDGKRRRTTSSPTAGRVSYACRACATARVKCEEVKPCARCRHRNLACEYASPETGSAAAMHLLHLSSNANPSATTAERIVSSSSEDNKRHITPPDISSSPQPSHQLRSQDSKPGHITNTANRPPQGPRENQLPASVVIMEQRNTGHPTNEHDMLSETDTNIPNVTFSNFLRDVLYESGLDATRAAENQGMDVLDFCDDSNLQLTQMDFGILDNWNVEGVDGMYQDNHQLAPGLVEPVDLSQLLRKLVKVWSESPWRWHPKQHDNAWGEQSYLPLPVRETAGPAFQEARTRLDRVIPDHVDPSGRDRILAVVLTTCRNNAMVTKVSSSFPPVDVIDTLVHIFLASHQCQVSTWIHYPSINLNAQGPEWLAVTAAAGALLTSVQTLRKFGFALQEAVRVTIPERFEDNNSAIKNASLVQAVILGQDIGLWSGNRRKMEIAECHLAIPITMLRYRSKFQRSSYPVIVVYTDDEGEVLEAKWRDWYERESWKRLVFHCYVRDAQISMTTLTNTSISYAELTAPLPEARELWFAKSASEWKARYLERGAGQSKRPPSICDLIRDISLVAPNRLRLDAQFAISIYLHGVWSLILDYQQLSAVQHWRPYLPSAGSTNALLSSRHQELCSDLERFQILTQSWHDFFSAQERVVLHLLMMNLHVSMDDLQLFSGKEGEEQARRIYPILQHWVAGSHGRNAIWHAGQIFKWAKMFPIGHLKDFYAVAVHHAALALWTFSVVMRASRRGLVPAHFGMDLVYLDGDETPPVLRFLRMGQGRPVIRSPPIGEGEAEAFLEDTKDCMDISYSVLHANFAMGNESPPPIVENLCQLIKQLGAATWAVGLG